jgi:glyoxylase-like metal-dependent hydrolase (beta-lactamase superfamily II)
MFFRQVKHGGDNFSYVIADETTKEAVVVDPSFNSSAIIQLLEEHGFDAKYVVDTHHHGDHTAGNDEIKSAFHAKIVAYKQSHIKKDVGVADGELIRVGKVTIKVIYTPGHTADSICLLADNKLLTGDTLFVGECGRTDMPGSSSEDMYNSLFQKIVKLDDNIEVYPGHDYGPAPYSTIGKEKKTNYTLKPRTLQDFIEFMQMP